MIFRLIVEVDMSTWTSAQIATYQKTVWQLLGGKENILGDTQIWVFEARQGKQ